jgi:hypothetical protein
VDKSCLPVGKHGLYSFKQVFGLSTGLLSEVAMTCPPEHNGRAFFDKQREAALTNMLAN